MAAIASGYLCQEVPNLFHVMSIEGSHDACLSVSTGSLCLAGVCDVPSHMRSQVGALEVAFQALHFSFLSVQMLGRLVLGFLSSVNTF